MNIEILDSRHGSIWPEPTRETTGSAGIDLRVTQDTKLLPGETKMANSGLAVALPDGHVGYVMPRSGMGHKRGLVLGNTVGVIDPDYRGEIKMSLWNRSNEVIFLDAGDRVAQLVVQPISLVDIELVDDIGDTERGSGGFGSTGK